MCSECLVSAGMAGPRAHTSDRPADVQSHRETAGLPAAGQSDVTTATSRNTYIECLPAPTLTCVAQLQVYATPPAFDQDPAAFHRAMFVFISQQVGA